jgi:glutathione peroxidase
MFNIAISLVYYIVTSIFSLQFQDSNGATVNMNSFQGKKILLVNIATNSPRVNQLAGLQQLQQQYGDSLVVIAFPSNSFGNESRSDADIKQFCQSTYNTSFIIATKGSVSGANLQSIYNWLSKSADNGDMNLLIGGDFQKVLIAKDGSIQGVFSPKLDPTSDEIRDAITTSY